MISSQNRKSVLFSSVIVICLLILFLLPAFANTISCDEAIYHVGEYQAVKGTIVSTHYARGSRGRPTFLNMGHPYPKQDFTILIWGSDRGYFSGAPEKLFNKMTVIVTGKISQYRGVPQIIVKNPSQIKILK